MVLAFLLFPACAPPSPPAAPVPESQPTGPSPSLWPADRAARADACVGGDAPACAPLAAAARREWAESIVEVSYGGALENHYALATARYFTSLACRAGDALACTDLGATAATGDALPPDALFVEGVPFTRTITLEDEAGVPRAGVEVRVFLPPTASLAAMLHADAHGRIQVPEAVTGATLETRAFAGPIAERVVLPNPRFVDLPAARSHVTRPVPNPWETAAPAELLAGEWVLQPNAASAQTRSAGPILPLDLPGSTGGGNRPPADPSPDTLRFEAADGTLTLDGDAASIQGGFGVLRLSVRGGAWLVPVERDTLVYVPRGEDWPYPEVYRRK